MKAKPQRLHLVDGTFELFRAHYAKRPSHRGPGGKDLKATVGLSASLRALLSDSREAVTHVAVAFDNPIRSFRNDLFANYKSDDGVDADLRAQFDDAEEAVRALGVKVWSMREFETDDAIATAVAHFAQQVGQVRILSPDKDFGQCLRGDQVVLVDRIRNREITEAQLRETRGFGPESLPDFLALVGDTADGIPGLPGWGEKGAASVLAAHAHLEDIPSDCSQWMAKVRGAEKLSAVLEANKEAALLYRRLATLRLDAPIDLELEALAWTGLPKNTYEGWRTSVGLGVSGSA